MTAIVWDEAGKRRYEVGVDRGVFYRYKNKNYEKGVAWNGLSKVTNSPSGAEASATYADNIKYLNIISTEEWSGTIEAYTYPDEFETCNGLAAIGTGINIGQQPRDMFGLVYRSQIGNDVDGSNAGYKLHILYGLFASPAEESNETIGDNVEPMAFSWSVSSTPINVTGHKPTSTLTIDSTKIDAAKLKKIEDSLYGTADKEPTLLTPDEVLALIA